MRIRGMSKTNKGKALIFVRMSPTNTQPEVICGSCFS